MKVLTKKGRGSTFSKALKSIYSEMTVGALQIRLEELTQERTNSTCEDYKGLLKTTINEVKAELRRRGEIFI